MRKNLFATLLALVVFTTFLPLNFSVASAQRRRVRRAPPSTRVAPTAGDSSARLNSIADAYLRGYYAFNPTEATAAGLHEYDAQLESRSRESVNREVGRLRASLAELSRVPEWRLAPEAHYDYLVLQSHARARLLELEDVRMWQRDPNVYQNLVAASVDNILKRNYAPVEQRLDAVLARERQTERLLTEARENLQSPPRIYTETAIKQARGGVEFFSRVVPQMFERAGGGRLSAARRAEFAASNDGVIAALRSFVEWLQNDLLPRSTGDYAIGAENFRKKLLYEEMVDAPLATLVRDGEQELRRTQDAMRALAEEIAPGRGIRGALQTLEREHPSADGLVGETRAELGRIRAFVRTAEITTMPANEYLLVAETPEYERALNFASMDAPGAFERVAGESFYYVTPPDPALSAQQIEEHLGHFNRYSLTITSINEAYPGHYYQLLKLRESPPPSRVRAALASSSFVEGWAHYCEQMMLDEGFGGNNPKLRLAQLDAALLRLCRYVVGIRLHTAGMSYEEGVEFFMREGYLARTNAEREARGGTLDPTYLVYTLGKMEILKLREEWRAQMGESFRLMDFHDRLLSYGMPPVRILRMAMLGDDNKNARGNDAKTNGGGALIEEAKPLDFSVLATGASSNHEAGRAVELITDEAEWQKALAVIGNTGLGRIGLPDVNFNTHAVVIVYQGQQASAGYGVEITGIKRVGTVLAVSINARRPASGVVTADVITSPFVAVSIARPPTGATVRFADGTNGIESLPENHKENVKPRGRIVRRQRRRGH